MIFFLRTVLAWWKHYLGRDSNNTRKLISVNRKFWSKAGAFNPASAKVIVVEHAAGRNFWSLVVSISAALVASAYKARVVFLMEGRRPQNPWILDVQKSFCSCSFVYLGEHFERNEELISREAETLFSLVKSPEDILSIRYKDIPIGEQIYDGVIKYKNATIWRVDERVRKQIVKAVNCVDTMLGILDGGDVVAGMFTHTTCTYHGVAVRTLLSRGKPVYIGFGGLKAMYCYNRWVGDRGHLDIHIKFPVSHFNSILNEHRERLLGKAEEYFALRFGGKVNDWDAMKAFSPDKKLYSTRQEFFDDYPRLDPGKRNVFVMLHAMNDDPHVQTQHLFRDYYDWFATTLKFAKEDRQVNWIFKQHPMIKFYPDDSNLHGLFDMIDPESPIVYIDEEVPFNQASVPMLADAIVTCAGTAGLEFAAFGIPAIIAAGNSYSGFGICLEPKSRDEYLETLRRAASIERLDKEQVERAKILFYLIYNRLIPGYLTGFFPYMNHGEMKALSDADAGRLFVTSLSNSKHGEMISFRDAIIGNKNNEDAYLILRSDFFTD
jgi:hypothetical protein